ncbi:MAG: redoxin family protein [Pseudolabrys sp.]
MPIALPATEVTPVNLSKLRGRTVVYVYPRTGVPGVDTPDGWDQIPGARGCTPQSCSFHDHSSSRAWASRSSMVCRHRTPPIRRRRRRGCTCRLRFLSDEKLTLTRALNLPTFSTELKRMALVIDDNTITKVFYPVFPPDKNAAEVIAWLQRSR